jgi:hypothetical protein
MTILAVPSASDVRTNSRDAFIALKGASGDLTSSLHEPRVALRTREVGEASGHDGPDALDQAWRPFLRRHGAIAGSLPHAHPKGSGLRRERTYIILPHRMLHFVQHDRARRRRLAPTIQSRVAACSAYLCCWRNAQNAGGLGAGPQDTGGTDCLSPLRPAVPSQQLGASPTSLPMAPRTDAPAKQPLVLRWKDRYRPPERKPIVELRIC